MEFYKKMVAFVMAYSFTEHAQQEEEEEDDGKTAPVMVPMADILNHIAKNNACLKFEKEAFKMVATKPIKKVSKSLLVLFVYLERFHSYYLCSPFINC